MEFLGFGEIFRGAERPTIRGVMSHFTYFEINGKNSNLLGYFNHEMVYVLEGRYVQLDITF